MKPKLRTTRWLLLLALLAIAGMVSPARAQVVTDDADEVPVPAVVEVVVQQNANFDQMEQWVFGRYGGSGGARTRLDALLLMRIDDIERVCGLTDDQKRKLRLAGRGDIKRFFDKVEEVKRKYQQGQNDPNINIWQAIQPLQVEINAGLFGDDSIYAKTIRRTLKGDQTARFEGLVRERKRLRYRATVEWFVFHLDKGLGLTEVQRQQFVERLISDSRPPTKFGQGDYWYLMLQTARLPESKIRPIFAEPQWRLLSRQFVQARGMESWLKTNGVVPDDQTMGEKAAMAVIPAMRLAPAAPIEKTIRQNRPVGKQRD